jgi:hypothetical protein
MRLAALFVGTVLACASAMPATAATIVMDGTICTNACFSYNETDITPDYLARFGPAFGDLMGKPYELVITNGTSYSLTINNHTVSWQQGDQHIAIAFNDTQTQTSFGTGAWKWTDQESNQYGIAFAETLYGCPTDPVPGVPEPATWAMMLLGFAFLGGWTQRRRFRATAGACGQ